MSGIDLQRAGPGEVYAAIAAMSEDEFADLMNEPGSRERVIEAMIDELVGRFRPEQAEGIEAVIHVKLWDRPDGGYEHFEMRIVDRRCELSEQPAAEPDLTLKVRPTDLRKLILGETGARRLAFRGRLRVIGDIGLGLKLPDLFDF